MADKLDLNSLRLFYDVVNAQSITRAANELGMPKSTISRKLTLLEQQVGTILLKKGQRRLTTTEIGTRFYEHCRRVVDEVEQAGLDTLQLQTALRGALRVSIPIDFGVSWIGKAIAEFVLAYPALELEVDVNSRPVNPREDPYDLTIQLGPLKDTDLTYRRIATITRGVYASPEYLQRRGVPLSVDELHRHDCIITAQQRLDGIWTLRNEATHRFANIEGKVVVNNISIAREMAIGHVGMSMLPNVMCANDLRTGRLQRVLRDWESPSMHATALVLSRKGMPSKIRTFLDFIADRLSLDQQQARDA
jgi:DNA-binding transcriptional LysR family regulator